MTVDMINTTIENVETLQKELTDVLNNGLNKNYSRTGLIESMATIHCEVLPQLRSAAKNQQLLEMYGNFAQHVLAGNMIAAYRLHDKIVSFIKEVLK